MPSDFAEAEQVRSLLAEDFVQDASAGSSVSFIFAAHHILVDARVEAPHVDTLWSLCLQRCEERPWGRACPGRRVENRRRGRPLCKGQERTRAAECSRAAASAALLEPIRSFAIPTIGG